jgi:hypothetical protein
MTYTPVKFSCLCALVGLAATWISAAQAQDASNQQLPALPVATAPANIGVRASPRSPAAVARPLVAWPAVNDSRLDAVRGGFDVGDGLLVSFGFERLVYVNGNLVSSTRVNIPNVGQVTSDQAAALAAAMGTTNVIQNGAGNRFDPSTLNHTTAATVIQNSLDNQNLQSLTTINAAVNSLDIFLNLSLQDSLQAGLVGSLGH